MKKRFTQKEVAEHLGLSPAQVCKHKKKGMPVDSLTAAKNWYDLNIDKPTKTLIKEVKEQGVAVNSKLQEVANNIDEDTSNLNDVAAMVFLEIQHLKNLLDSNREDLIKYKAVLSMITVVTDSYRKIEEGKTEVLRKRNELIDIDVVKLGVNLILATVFNGFDSTREQLTNGIPKKHHKKTQDNYDREINDLKEALVKIKFLNDE